MEYHIRNTKILSISIYCTGAPTRIVYTDRSVFQYTDTCMKYGSVKSLKKRAYSIETTMPDGQFHCDLRDHRRRDVDSPRPNPSKSAPGPQKANQYKILIRIYRYILPYTGDSILDTGISYRNTGSRPSKRADYRNYHTCMKYMYSIYDIRQYINIRIYRTVCPYKYTIILGMPDGDGGCRRGDDGAQARDQGLVAHGSVCR